MSTFVVSALVVVVVRSFVVVDSAIARAQKEASSVDHKTVF